MRRGFLTGEQPVNGGRTDLLELFLLRGQQRVEVLGILGQPFVAELFGVFPRWSLARRRQLGSAAAGRVGTAFAGRQQVAQQFDGVFAVVAVLLAQLIKHAGVTVFVSPRILLAQHFQMFVPIQ